MLLQQATKSTPLAKGPLHACTYRASPVRNTELLYIQLKGAAGTSTRAFSIQHIKSPNHRKMPHIKQPYPCLCQYS